MASNMYYKLGSSEIQADDNGLQTLHLMLPNFVGYNHAPPLPQSAHQQFMGIPLTHENHPSRPPPVLQEDDQIQAVHNSLIQRFHYNTWDLADPDRQKPVQGLSLCLNSPHQSRTAFNNHRQDFPATSSIGGMNIISPGNCSSHQSLTATDDQSTGINYMQSHVIMGSKYLKAAQELLDEVASVGKNTTGDPPEKAPARDKMAAKMVKESTSESGTELTTAQRQEIQMKKAKLNVMLDEVEQRYRQYHQQMQLVVATFEQAAGLGSAKTYTHVALKTILKQFRCLKATISGRIKALNRSLGEEESSDGKKAIGGSMRLKFVDHQQMAAMHQQMGMIMHNNNINNAWRPQRGLPERAVSVLRAWLFEHFLHPYPKDADKQMLAKQTGLTRSQVSNWFINARVRLWKPMVEEMYLEETKNNNNQQPNEMISSKLPAQDHSNKLEYSSSENNPAKKQRINDDTHQDNSLTSSILSVDETETMKQPANHQTSMIFSNVVKFGNTHGDHNHEQTRDNQNFFSSMASANTRDQIRIGGLGRFNGGDQYQHVDGNFQGNNSFSLSLALPPASRETSYRNFEFGTRIESGIVESDRVRGMIDQGNPNNIGINCENILDFQNRKPFPAHQLLPDFVA